MRRKILPYNKHLKVLARKLRKEMTIAEAMLWKALKGKQMMGLDFDRQRPIDNYIVDFYCKDLMLAIEVDGITHYHEQGAERDGIRQKKLEQMGVRLLRFDDDDVKTNINGVLDIIREWIQCNPEMVGRISSQPLPPPDPSREGSYFFPAEKKSRRKKNPLFHFKQFAVRHNRSGMKVGTDGVLLGAWVDVAGASRVLDIGTGTGVIALMLAQRTQSSAKIEAIEIDENALEDARENFVSSPWQNRLTLHQGSIQNFIAGSQYDLIVSNPPFFIGSFKPPDAQRIVARHTDHLTFEELLLSVQKLLSENGRFNVILPYVEGLQFIDMAMRYDLHCTRKWSFRTRQAKPIERWMLEFSRTKAKCEEGEILLYSSGEEWSEGYKRITHEFYLKL